MYFLVIFIQLCERHLTQRKPTLVNISVIEGMYKLDIIIWITSSDIIYMYCKYSIRTSFK